MELDRERLSDSLRELSKIDCEVVRIEGVIGDNLDDEFKLIASSGVVGCWHSHQAAYAYMLQNDLSCAVVVEDDVMIPNATNFMRALANAQSSNLDIAQIGFIAPHPIARFELIYQNFEHFLISIMKKNTFLANRFGYKISRLVRYEHFPSIFVPDEFLSGTHCYFISNQGARKLSGMNIPVMVPADGYLRNLIKLGYLNGGRVVHSLARQRALTSTITGTRNEIR